MSKKTDNIAVIAIANGLQYDAANNMIYGKKNGYDLLIYGALSDPSRYYVLDSINVNTSAERSAGGPLSEGELAELMMIMMSKNVPANVSQDGYIIKVSFNRPKVAQDALKDVIREILNTLISFLNIKGFQPCCSMCGQRTETAGFMADITYMHLCPDCERQARRNAMAIADRQNRSDHMAGGIIGAVLGSLVGVALLILLGRIGYMITIIPGILLGYGVLRGYELLGGCLSKKGVVISIVIMLIMTYVGYRLCWAVRAYHQEFHSWGASYFDCFKAVPELIRIGSINVVSYIGNLIMLCVVLWLSASFTIHTKLPSGRIVKIGHTKN